eukprot:scaffold432_cov95-Skeletonema_marinoi.AAC.1
MAMWVWDGLGGHWTWTWTWTVEIARHKPIFFAIALYHTSRQARITKEVERTEHLACSHDDGGLSKLVGPFHVLLADDAVVWERALSPQQMEALALLQLAIQRFSK